MANRKYTSIKNDYCLILTEDTRIEKCADDPKITRFGFSFTSLANIEELPPNQRVDVIGLILEISEPTIINLKDGSKKEKRQLTLGDEGKVCIDIALWGAEISDRFNLQVGQVIALKSCRISEYYGRTLNASSDVNDVCVDLTDHERG